VKISAYYNDALDVTTQWIAFAASRVRDQSISDGIDGYKAYDV
jgi:hypothetical protein